MKRFSDNRELRTLQTLNVARLWRDYDNANPNIGMGPPIEMIIKNALDLLYYESSDVDVDFIKTGLNT